MPSLRVAPRSRWQAAAVHLASKGGGAGVVGVAQLSGSRSGEHGQDDEGGSQDHGEGGYPDSGSMNEMAEIAKLLITVGNAGMPRYH